MNQIRNSGTRSQAVLRGFTLVELLVVISIIAVLASLLLVAVNRGMHRARIAAVHIEVTQLNDAFTAYTNDVSGGAYPPNLVWANGIGVTATSDDETLNDFKRHFNKAFPKHRESDALLRVLAGLADNGGVKLIDAAGATRDGLSPYEAIVFWLGGFSDDPKYPISGPGGPSFVTNSAGTDQSAEDFSSRKPVFDFDQTRLGPRAADQTYGGNDARYITYDGPNGERRRINLWRYYPKNSELPYAYFDASRNPKFDPQYNGLVPIKALKTNATARTLANVRLANEGKCQILSAGLDNAWGPIAAVFGVDWTQVASNPTNAYDGLTYPDGPFTGELADTITNFSTGATLEDSQP